MKRYSIENDGLFYGVILLILLLPLVVTMVTSAGLVHNAGWQSINNEVDVDDLFHE